MTELKWSDLDREDLTEKERRELRTFLLNKQPRTEWIKTHPVYSNQYIPIDKIEWLLTKLYGNWHVEVKEVKQILNSVYCSIRLHYGDEFQDGAGAYPIQLKKGAAPSDISQIQTTGVMLAVPNSKILAVKDAADCIGRIFGRDLNRKDLINYSEPKFNNLK